MNKHLLRWVVAAAVLVSAPSVGGTNLSIEPPVAVIDGKPIFASDLLEASQGQVMSLRKQEYDIRRKALDTVIEQKLLDSEATRRGITPSELIQREMSGSVAEPTDGEIEAFYLGRTDSGTRRLDEVREQMRSMLKTAKRSAAREALLVKLRVQHGVEIMLETPRVDVAFDPGRLNGSSDAPVRIVEFSDFECPYCRNAEKTIQAVVAKYGGKVSLAYRDFPLASIHPSAQLAAEASRCAADQDKFWAYHGRLFASPTLDVARLKEIAREIGVDQKKFDLCLDSGSKRAAVDGDARAGRLAGVTGTPAFFINGIPLTGAQPVAAFERIIDEELAKMPKKTTTALR
jgi:predicted DsbA family dithiol-disulfide isomerase